ncbi:p13 [Trichoplusia ni granulovirus LBIV-12]|jgi:alpha-N-acetylglucosamine transferase|uniref:p13 n=2 Tax=Betabaculovirus TaxID=558017 RepID=A0A1D8QL42_GVTN|nr:P13 [Pseudalatia unipuncta granulovirus]YP_009506105.1 p13 [Trichoplusia ni granulovirus LBIV-12]ACH69391.1 P13 [Pseudalatia unipuncta granulovirus]AOW41374.1 p13 [Trichoplusia ni granulovirus LBIV-12]
MYAYATLVMIGDKYVAGALALGESLLNSGTKHQLVCMVTEDVSKAAVSSLSTVYNSVITVPYMSFKCGSMMTQRQKELYANWIDHAFTKWRVFQLITYQKILYLDADHVIVKNIDHLFDLEPPAMCFRSEFNKAFEGYKHGDRITSHDLKYFFKHFTSLAATGTLLLKPDTQTFQSIAKQLNTHNRYLQNNQFHNGFEEVVLIQTLIESKIDVTQLSQLYVWNAGCYKTIQRQEPYVINYYGDKKPWCKNSGVPRYMDEYIWRYFYLLCQQRIKDNFM